MQRKGLAILVIFLTILVLGGCVTEKTVEQHESSETSEYRSKMDDYHQQLSELEKLNKELEEEMTTQNIALEHYQSLIVEYEQQLRDIIEDYSDDQLLELAKSQFEYRLKVNESSIPKNGVLEIEANQVEIFLAEYRSELYFLPEGILEQGGLSEDYWGHILKVEPAQYEETWLDGTVNTAYGLIYSDLTSGDEIQLTISDELQQRLRLETNQVIIRIK